MPRDLLAQLKERQDLEPSEEVIDNETVTINMGDGEDNNNKFMDEFRKKADSVQEEIESVQRSTEHVREIHASILSSPEANQRNNELEDVMAQVKKSASRIRNKLKEIKQNAEEATEINPTSAIGRMKTIQQQALSKLFVEVMTDYNNAQLEYRDKCKGRIQRQLAITGRTTTDEELEEMLEKGDMDVFTQGAIMETAKAKQALADVEARHADIVKLEKSIMELRDMFIEMAVLVENQGEMINRIEYSVVNAAEYVKNAKDETKKAQEYQTSATKKKIWLIAILLVVILIIILVCVL